MNLPLTLRKDHGDLPLPAFVHELVIAGWTGRDQAAVTAHIQELRDLGVAPPRTTPVFYRVSAGLLTAADRIQVLGCHSSGEAEAVLLNAAGQLMVGLGSDHTDRKVEAIGVALSKQLCPKPLAVDLWEFADVEPHWDELILRSYVVEGGERSIYQEGPVASLRHPRDLMERYAGASGLRPCVAMFCGTLPAINGVRSGPEFAMELEDPVLKRSIKHSYAVEVLPVEG